MHSPRPRSPTHTPLRGSFAKEELGHGHVGRRRSGLRSRGTQLLALRFGWVVLVIWYEVGEFFSSLSSCKFPDSQVRPLGSRRKSADTTAPTHVVLLADPHVPHPKLSYPPDSSPWMNSMRQAMDELFMRKSWNVVMRLGRVDGVIVLGDMLDAGRGLLTDEEYESYFSLFGSIFRAPADVPMYFIPGNHDIPLGPNPVFSSKAKERYAKHFYPPNSVLEIANHSLVLLDSVGLVEEDYRRYAAEMQFGEWDGVEGGVIEFIKDLSEDLPPGPKILLSHIPLARPEAASCGPYREHGRISKGAGPGYQNLLGSETSRFLLEALKPSIVFSGDDHDYCDLLHPGGVREITVKSFSSSAGIRRPGLQLLSLVSPESTAPGSVQATFAHRPCFLPDQAGVYSRVYFPLIILTVLFLFATNVRNAWQRWTVNGGSFYHDLKSRLSPGMQSSDTVPNNASIRRVSDRPVPLPLPSRKSSQHLNGLTALTPSTSSFAPRPQHAGSTFDPRSSRSAPVSPSASPRMGYAETDDETDTPSTSRRSSYIYMHGKEEINHLALPVTSEPASYFLPLPTAEGRHGLGLGSPGLRPNGSGPVRRGSSSHANISPLSMSPNTSTTNLSAMGKRSSIPRVLSTSDWSSAAKAKDKSVIEFMMDSLPVPGTSKRKTGGGGGGSGGGVSGPTVGWETLRGFMRWAWKARNGVVMRSWREVLAVAWPPALVWLMINALFFWE